jgi:hypothetical protein
MLSSEPLALAYSPENLNLETDKKSPSPMPGESGIGLARQVSLNSQWKEQRNPNYASSHARSNE